VAWLLELAQRERLGGWVLLPTDDQTAALLARHSDQLGDQYRVATSGWEATRVAYDKRETHRFAAELGVPQPWTSFPPSRAAVAGLECRFPVVIKPAVKAELNDLTAAKAWRVEDGDELLSRYDEACALVAPEIVMVQELVAGGSGAQQLSYVALCRDGEVLADATARRLRQQPMDFGLASSYVETTDPIDASAHGARLLNALRFTGIVEVEFKRDPRDGEPKLLDINARVWGWHTLCIRAGVDFVALWWDLLHGRDVPRVTARAGVRWVRMATDLPTAVGEIRRGRLRPGEYAGSLKGPLEHAIYSPDDPLPALVDVPYLAWLHSKRALRARSDSRSAKPRRSAGLAAGTRRRVLMISENAPVPSDRRVWNESRALREAGYDVTVVCAAGTHRFPDGRQRAQEVLEGVEILRYPLEPAANGLPSYAREYGQALWRIRRLLRRAADRGRFDVVHAANPPDFLLLAAIELRRAGTRFVFDHHDLVPELFEARFGDRPLRRMRPLAIGLEQIAFRLADVVLSTNESYRRIALERGQKRPEDVFVVRNGPDLRRFRPVPPDPSLRADGRHLVSYLGVMGPQDGIDHALRALAALRARRGDDWKAVFIGEGEMMEPMQRFAAELGLNGLVEFAGWRYDDDIRRILSSSDVCIVPDPPTTLNDLSSMVKVPEYMAMGRAIASYDLTETRFSAGDAASYARPGDPDDLGRCVNELLDDPELRARMGAAGRDRVRTSLAWEHSVEALLAAYERALGTASPPPMRWRRTGGAKRNGADDASDRAAGTRSALR
jgi:predicted ATP-grasp superfamily ATP-dependent carboligase/glycosyltransferase involved in cell wall biosynthesis